MPPAPQHHPHAAPVARPADSPKIPRRDHESGSMTTEYGLIVVVGATLTSLVIKWASGGAVFELLGSVLTHAKSLVGL